MKTVILVIMAIVAINAILATAFFYLRNRKKSEEKPSEPEPVEEPVSKSKFKVGDWVVNNEDGSVCQITKIVQCKDSSFGYEHTNGYFHQCFEKDYHLWTVQDAKDGDVIFNKDYTTKDSIFIFSKMIDNLYTGFYIRLFGEDDLIVHRLDDTGGVVGGEFYPATKEQTELLLSKMTEAGYQWDAETKTLSKVEEEPLYKQGDRCRNKENPKDEVVILAIVADQYKYYGTGYEFEKYEFFKPFEAQYELIDEEPKENDADSGIFMNLIGYFSSVVSIPINGETYQFLRDVYDKCLNIFNGDDDEKLYDQKNFPTIYSYWGSDENEYAFEQMTARVFSFILYELVPDKAEILAQMGYDYKVKGASQATYDYTFDSDPNIARDIADFIYAVSIDDDKIDEMREELGGQMVSYKNDVSELFLDNTKWMPTAPPPYLDEYKERPKGEPFDSDYTEYMDNEINSWVALYYNLDTKDAVKRQETIQAISNKEYKKPHLFGKPRTVVDPVYGTMTFNPVFGVHNIGIEIDPNGKIADLAYSIGRICSDSRKPLLDQEYGRKRPAQGDSDPSANPIAERRALVNEAIENGDGHSTGHYEKNGDYVFDDGTHVGNYVDYYQEQQYANSYTSGHSGHIKGVAMVLAMIMPDKVCDILKAMIEFCNGRIICRYHNQSDVIHGRGVGAFIVPVLRACKNIDFKNRLAAAREEYKNGGVVPTPTDKVNVTLSYSCGGYGSCHVDAGETSISHKCNKEANRDRQPSIICSQTVNFTIEGDSGVTAAGGKTSGVFEANKSYVLFCPAVKEGEEKIAKIILNNNNGTRILYYKLSWNGTHDDGVGIY